MLKGYMGELENEIYNPDMYFNNQYEDEWITDELAILRQVWGSAMESDMASLRVFMVSLRKKLAKGGGRQYLQTHVGIGYRLG